MKKTTLLIFVIAINMICQAQVVRTLNVSPGIIQNAIESDIYEVTDLTLTGKIDARDFRFMRDFMTKLKIIDLTKVTIVAYTGVEGPAEEDTIQTISYPANTIPDYAFYRPAEFEFENGEVTVLTSVKLPESAISIGKNAFQSCLLLESITFPSSLKTIAEWAFNYCNAVKTIYMNCAIPPMCDSNDFLKKTTDNCILYVPKGSITAYKKAFDWKYFINIKEM
jgi:hypothetical protein